jgi:acetyl esterase/lipase
VFLTEKFMKFAKMSLSTLAAAALLVACGGGGDDSSFDLSGAPGSLIAEPTTLTTLTPAAFQQAAPASLFLVAGTPRCTITFNYFQYGTTGGAGEKTTASGGIMVPSGADPACQGPRPVLLYAHGTSLDKNKNMASPQDGEAALVAAVYAAQGYIVVAPNYAGYEASTLSYHPYLNLQQQGQEMVDALAAARKAFPAVGTAASNMLFVSGYSQGGFVSMAAQRALQQVGTTVTAGAHLSGVYALGAFGDAVFGVQVNAGATLFAPLLYTSLQRAYGDIYATPSDLYEATFATGIETLLPSTTPINTLIGTGKLPATALFAADQAAPGTFGFGTPNLIKTSYRNAVLADAVTNPDTPQHPLRRAAFRNDLLKQDWTPTRPMLLCGGNADPTVFFAVNTSGPTGAKAYFNSKNVPDQAVTVLDVDVDPATINPADPFARVKGGFAQLKAATAPAEVLARYHGELVPPFCNAAAKGYFSQFMAP